MISANEGIDSMLRRKPCRTVGDRREGKIVMEINFNMIRFRETQSREGPKKSRENRQNKCVPLQRLGMWSSYRVITV